MFKAITNGKTRREEFTYRADTEEFIEIFQELGGNYEQPEVIGKEGGLYSLYYSSKPSMFTDDAELYALKIDMDTGVESRKSYFRSNLSGIETDYDVIATGVFLDDTDSFTLYHGEGVTFEEAITMAKPYTGTTYKNGEITRVTEYKKE